MLVKAMLKVMYINLADGQPVNLSLHQLLTT